MDTDNLLDSLDARAQRQLDGMTTNRDTFSRDVMRLTMAIRAARWQAQKQPAKAEGAAGFGPTFDKLFADIFKQTGGTP